MKAVLIGFFLIIAALSHVAFGQRESKEELDRPFVEAEKRDAIILAKSFTRRFQETQDLEPILVEFMAPDFMEYAKQDHYFNAFVFQDEKLIRKLPEALQRRFFVEATNFFLLTLLYQLVTDPSDSTDGMKHPRQIQPIVNKYFDWQPRGLKSTKQVSVATRDFSKVNKGLRPSLAKIRSMSEQELLKVMKDETPFGELGRIEVSRCENKHLCRGLPLNSRIFGVPIPFGFLEIGEFNRKMKVIGFIMFPGD